MVSNTYHEEEDKDDKIDEGYPRQWRHRFHRRRLRLLEVVESAKDKQTNGNTQGRYDQVRMLLNFFSS